MDNAFLGKGFLFGLPADGIGAGDDGRILESSDDEIIRQSIWLILGTAPGERVGRPDFGCGIHDLVFAPRTAGTLGDVIRAVSDALAAWEPRVDAISVDASPHPDDPNGLLIQIEYRVRATSDRFNLVYPFYLST
jgi:uncharacterized protein